MTTKRSYEDQLSMMSDHLCSMNETLTKQREEIDTLKMTSKGNSKKNKTRQLPAHQLSVEAAAEESADTVWCLLLRKAGWCWVLYELIWCCTWL